MRYFDLTSKLETSNDTAVFVEKLNVLIDKNPLCESALQTRAFFSLIQNNFNQANVDLNRTLKINKNNIYALYGLASLYNLDSKNDSAYYFITSAINEKSRLGYAIDQNNFFSRKFDIPLRELVFFRGIILYEGGLFQKAKIDFLKSVALEHEGGEAFAYLASIYFKEGNIDSACTYNLRAKRLEFRDTIDSLVELKCK